LDHADHQVRADWYALHATVLGSLRDFDAAEHWFGRAQLLAPERPWIWVEGSTLRRLEDRNEEAVEMAQHALKLRPWYRPAVQAAAYLLSHVGKDAEALALLTQAAQVLESGNVWMQLGMLHEELGDHQQADDCLERCVSFFPLIDKHQARWLAARRSDTAYYVGVLFVDRRKTERSEHESPPRPAARRVRGAASCHVRPGNADGDQPLLVDGRRSSPGSGADLLRRHAGAQRAALG
jgi:tetratricopeptide (TPR) repeat protein